MPTRIVIYGGSFAPPTINHREIALRLAKEFDRVVVIPCGPRADKTTEGQVAMIHRQKLVERGFAGLPNSVELDMVDLQTGTYRSTAMLEREWAGRCELWHAVGSDLIRPDANGLSDIRRYWVDGERLWQELRFVVISRPAYLLTPTDLPPKHIFCDWNLDGSSTQVRQALAASQTGQHLLTESVMEYIEENKLWREP